VPDGLRGLEKIRKMDLEDWMDDLKLDAVLFPTVADVGPADADVNPASADIAWSNGCGWPMATSPSATLAYRR
jgi:amidase